MKKNKIIAKENTEIYRAIHLKELFSSSQKQHKMALPKYSSEKINNKNNVYAYVVK